MLDDDDYYNYHGGLISAVKKLKGSFPSSYSTNAADPNRPETRSIHEDTSRIMRARINNPQWIAGLKDPGFRGAQEFAAMVDIVFGWDAAANVVDDWMYESIAAAYLLDNDTRDWLTKANPWALHAISERLLEAEKRGMWNAKEETLESIRAIYLNTEGELEDK
jgi:cobaltochelatase CobN